MSKVYELKGVKVRVVLDEDETVLDDARGCKRCVFNDTGLCPSMAEEKAAGIPNDCVNGEHHYESAD